MTGGIDDDTLDGGLFHDTLNGGHGDDVLIGGHGSDVFQLSKGIDVVEDFKFDDGDKIDLGNIKKLIIEGDFQLPSESLFNSGPRGVLIGKSLENALLLKNIYIDEVTRAGDDLFY